MAYTHQSRREKLACMLNIFAPCTSKTDVFFRVAVYRRSEIKECYVPFSKHVHQPGTPVEVLIQNPRRAPKRYRSCFKGSPVRKNVDLVHRSLDKCNGIFCFADKSILNSHKDKALSFWLTISKNKFWSILDVGSHCFRPLTCQHLDCPTREISSNIVSIRGATMFLAEIKNLKIWTPECLNPIHTGVFFPRHVFFVPLHKICQHWVGGMKRVCQVFQWRHLWRHFMLTSNLTSFYVFC